MATLSQPSSQNPQDYIPVGNKARQYVHKDNPQETISLRQFQRVQRGGLTYTLYKNEQAAKKQTQTLANETGRPILLKVQIQSTPTPPSQPSVKQGKNTYWSAVYLYTSKHPGTTIADTRSDPDFKQLYKDLMTRINELKAAKDLKGATKDTTIIGIMNAMGSYDDDEWDFIYF